MIAECEADEQQGRLLTGGKRLPQGPKVSSTNKSYSKYLWKIRQGPNWTDNLSKTGLG